MKNTEIAREFGNESLPGSRVLKWIAFLGINRERQRKYASREREREREISGGDGRDERRMEDEARAITWLGLSESLDVPFERSSMIRSLFGVTIRHEKLRGTSYVIIVITRFTDEGSPRDSSTFLLIEIWRFFRMRGDGHAIDGYRLNDYRIISRYRRFVWPMVGIIEMTIKKKEKNIYDFRKTFLT